MPKYEVRIRAIINKLLDVEAENEQKAIELAHTQFSVLCESGDPEEYTQECVGIDKIG